MMEYRYAREKLLSAVGAIDSEHTGRPIQERLCGAFLEMHTLQAQHFPEELRGEWEAIHDEFVRFRSVNESDGTAKASTDLMTDADAIGVAARIRSLLDRVPPT